MPALRLRSGQAPAGIQSRSPDEIRGIPRLPSQGDHKDRPYTRVVARMKSGESLAPFSFFAIFVKADVSSVKDTWYTRAKKTPKLSKRYEFLSLAHIVLS